MSKKKVQHKGKTKTATQKNDDYTLHRSDNESSDEYTTVVDSEINRKYCKRIIQNNWSKYDSAPPVSENEDDGLLPHKTDDFSHLINTASSDFSHFQLNSEKLWISGENSMPSSSIFNLHLNILSGGLACVPFHERMGLDESVLSAEDKLKFQADADKNKKEYSLLMGKLLKKGDEKSDVKNSDSLNIEKSFKDKLDLSTSKDKDSNEGEVVKRNEENVKDVEKSGTLESGDTKGDSEPEFFFGEEVEDLEDWLDSVLDD